MSANHNDPQPLRPFAGLRAAVSMPDVAATAAPHPKSGVMAEAVASLQAVRSQIHVGSLNTGTFKPAFKDGSLPSSRFRRPVSVARIPGGRGVVIADTGNNAIREIILAGEGVVRTLPGGRWLRPTDLCSMSEAVSYTHLTLPTKA